MWEKLSQSPTVCSSFDSCSIKIACLLLRCLFVSWHIEDSVLIMKQFDLWTIEDSVFIVMLFVCFMEHRG